MTGQYDSAPSNRLPIMALAKASYNVAFSKAAWNMPLILIPVLLSIVLSWIGSMIPEATLDSAGGKLPDLKTMDPLQKRHMLEMLVLLPLQLLFLAALGISWRRYIVRGEKPSGAYFGGSLWRYLGYIIVFLLAFAGIATLSIPLVLIFMPHVKGAHPPATSVLALVVIGAIFVTAALWIVTRCVLKFIGVGIDDHDMTLNRSSALMKGNVWPWIAATFLIMVPLSLVSSLLGLIEKQLPDDSLIGTLLINGLGGGVLGVLQSLLSASFSGLAYRHLVPGNSRNIVA
jgi:hypothetical protein